MKSSTSTTIRNTGSTIEADSSAKSPNSENPVVTLLKLLGPLLKALIASQAKEGKGMAATSDSPDVGSSAPEQDLLDNLIKLLTEMFGKGKEDAKTMSSKPSKSASALAPTMEEGLMEKLTKLTELMGKLVEGMEAQAKEKEGLQAGLGSKKEVPVMSAGSGEAPDEPERGVNTGSMPEVKASQPMVSIITPEMAMAGQSAPTKPKIPVSLDVSNSENVSVNIEKPQSRTEGEKYTDDKGNKMMAQQGGYDTHEPEVKPLPKREPAMPGMAVSDGGYDTHTEASTKSLQDLAKGFVAQSGQANRMSLLAGLKVEDITKGANPSAGNSASVATNQGNTHSR